MNTENHATAVRLVALVPTEMEDGSAPLGAWSAASALAERFATGVEALVLGADPTHAGVAGPVLAGATSVWFCTHPKLAAGGPLEQLVEAFAQALARLGIGSRDVGKTIQPALVLLPPGPAGEELAARLAVRCGGAALGHCADIWLDADGIHATRMAFGGRIQMELSGSRLPCFATMRALKPAISPVLETGSTPTTATKRAAGISYLMLDGHLPPVPQARRRDLGESKAQLDGARMVVSGGRGMGGAAGFALLDELAGQLGAALGGSLPTVDAGWIPVARQVGQSGKYVAPDVYIAVGISGTPQHMAGIDPGTRIVAINSDPGADIFKFAEVGMVEDWGEALPALLKQLRLVG